MVLTLRERSPFGVLMCCMCEATRSAGDFAPAHPRTRAPAHPRTRAPAHPRTRTPAHPHTCAPASVQAPAHLRTRAPFSGTRIALPDEITRSLEIALFRSVQWRKTESTKPTMAPASRR
jgi:hypothetical protein